MAEIELAGGVLKVSGDLRSADREEFAQAVDALLESSEENLTVDLTEVDFLLSVFVSQIVRFCQMATEEGKDHQVLVGPSLREIFESTGLAGELPVKFVG